MDHRSKAEIAQARRNTVDLEAQAAQLLWARLRDGVRSDDLAAGAADHEETLSRTTGGSARFRLAILLTLIQLDPEGGRQMLRLLLEPLGYQASPLEALALDEDLEDLVSDAGSIGGDVSGMICRYLRGGLDNHEKVDLRRALPQMIHAAQIALLKLEAEVA